MWRNDLVLFTKKYKVTIFKLPNSVELKLSDSAITRYSILISGLVQIARLQSESFLIDI